MVRQDGLTRISPSEVNLNLACTLGQPAESGMPVGQMVADHAAAEADALQSGEVSLDHRALQLLTL